MEKNIWPIERLKNWDKNPRGCTDEDFQRIKWQLKRWGQLKPLIVTADGTVLGGNFRLRAMRDLGVTEVWVSVVEAADENRKMEYALSDNDTVGRWSEDKLFGVLADKDLNLERYKFDFDSGVGLSGVVSDFTPDVAGENEGELVKTVLKLGKDDFVRIVEAIQRVQKQENLETHTQAILLLAKRYLV